MGELTLTNNPAFDRHKSNIQSGDGSYVDRHRSAFICPIARIEMNGSYPLLFDWTTGNVISERGHKEIKSDPASAIQDDNIVFLNPEENSSQIEHNSNKVSVR